MTSGLFGGSDVSGIESALSGVASAAEGYAGQAAALSPMFVQQGSQDIYPTALSQYQAGATGQITPNQQAAVDQTLQQEQLQNAGTYGNLGLGGSTMETQDANANKMKSLAQTQQFSNMDEMAGLSGLQQALGYESEGVNALTGAGSILGGATNALSGAGGLAQGQQQTQLGLLQSAGNALGGKGGGSSAGSSIF